MAGSRELVDFDMLKDNNCLQLKFRWKGYNYNSDVVVGWKNISEFKEAMIGIVEAAMEVMVDADQNPNVRPIAITPVGKKG